MQLKYLPNIKSPNDLKKLDSEEAKIDKNLTINI